MIPRPRPFNVTLSHYLNTSSVTMKWNNLSYCWPTLFNRNCSSPGINHEHIISCFASGGVCILLQCTPFVIQSVICIIEVIRPVSGFNVTTSALLGGLMDVHVDWISSMEEDVEYIVTVTDVAISTVPNCTSPGGNPPCFVARHTVNTTTSL